MKTLLQNGSIDRDFEIKEIDSIVAIEILRDTYKFDVTQYDKTQLRKFVDLVNLSITNRVIPEVKEVQHDDNTNTQK